MLHQPIYFTNVSVQRPSSVSSGASVCPKPGLLAFSVGRAVIGDVLKECPRSRKLWACLTLQSLLTTPQGPFSVPGTQGSLSCRPDASVLTQPSFPKVLCPCGPAGPGPPLFTVTWVGPRRWMLSRALCHGQRRHLAPLLGAQPRVMDRHVMHGGVQALSQLATLQLAQSLGPCSPFHPRAGWPG